mmetsp:Transcript_79798/g.165851  ORF Transcript_79798/g.165851 Transcript_79798/m.165851 type:complete len:81 (+) Transcript_79798:968-1210(+)
MKLPPLESRMKNLSTEPLKDRHFDCTEAGETVQQLQTFRDIKTLKILDDSILGIVEDEGCLTTQTLRSRTCFRPDIQEHV